MALEIRSYARTSKTERYPCSKRDIKAHFKNFDNLSVNFGLIKNFSFDRWERNKPQLSGPVVASITTPSLTSLESPWGHKGPLMLLYVVRADVYEDEARIDLIESAFPHLKKWLMKQASRTETAILGHEGIIVEWNGSKHIIHILHS